MRSLAREAVFKYIFSRLFNRDDEGLFDVLLINDGLVGDDGLFAKNLLLSVDANYDKYMNKIGEMSEKFKLSRVFNTDKCAILIGMAELDNFPETPVPVVINEAVNLAAKYSTEKSTDFVNGILARYAEEKLYG
ncbi:MAG: transcription antitermination protein NusB [Clostridia bacterium]|nr:transcription antitermination protein NusB [Clostridia bacterium]